jgi:glucose-6-phosphate 1-epimerase
MLREGPGGLKFIDIVNEQATATVCTQGAQLIHWQPRRETQPVTFIAAAVQYTAGKPLRGGIPVCWPWFGPHASDRSMSNHGFARNFVWQADVPVQVEGGATRLVLTLSDSEATRALWPHAFRLECRISAGDVLQVELATTNTGHEEFSYTEALHTYFRIGDIGEISVAGLDGTQYADSADGGARRRQSGPVRFTGEVDRVFLDTEAACTILDPRLGRRIDIEKSGSRSTVVWNPWTDKAGRFADLGSSVQAEGSWRQMVCIETANALDNLLDLAPGQTHCMTVRYQSQPL